MASSYLSSNLSNQKYEYDLVLGTTAKAINQTLKMYLFKNSPAPKQIWYGQAEAGGPVKPMDPISGVDPFAIKSHDDVPQSILDSDFVFAIKAGFGLPEGVSPLSIPDILILGTDKQKVHYNMFFNTFQICTLDWGRHGTYAWKNYVQEDGNPYIFTFQVDMNFDVADPNSQFSGLPADVQRQLKNYNTSTMFSVQQLYLDLNNAGLQSMPEISGIPSTSPLYPILQSDFINTYWKQMSQEGKFILGYAAHANSQPTSRTSLQPTDLNFMTVPFYNDDGSISNDHTLYTLNYLMDTNNRKLTVGAAFPWNWVKKDELNSYHGAMAVRREVFADYLINAISPYLCYISITPTTTYRQYAAGFKWSASYSLAQTPNKRFDYVSQPGSKVANYSFSASSHHSDKSGLISGHYNLDSSAGSSISISGNEITITTNAGMNIDFDNGDLGTASVEGYVGGYESTAIFVVSVDASGKVNVADKSGYPKQTVKPSHLSSGFMSGIDGVDGLTDSLTSNYAGMTNFMKNFAGAVENYLNNAGTKWIFPGGQTLLFKDAAFSENQDFVTHVTYADPG
jgi:hypothetical protein